MIIEVKRKHIYQDLPSDGSANCPIALAIRDTIGMSVSVGHKDAAILKNGQVKRRIKLPRSAQRFIKRFDHLRTVKPFNFKLNYEPTKN